MNRLMETMYEYRHEAEIPERITELCCSYCDYEISIGEEYYMFEDTCICQDCIKDCKCVAGEDHDVE